MQPVIYDTIEVLSGPPPEGVEISRKRRRTTNRIRRSKRMKLDVEKDEREEEWHVVEEESHVAEAKLKSAGDDTLTEEMSAALHDEAHEEVSAVLDEVNGVADEESDGFDEVNGTSDPVDVDQPPEIFPESPVKDESMDVHQQEPSPFPMDDTGMTTEVADIEIAEDDGEEADQLSMAETSESSGIFITPLSIVEGPEQPPPDEVHIQQDMVSETSPEFPAETNADATLSASDASSADHDTENNMTSSVEVDPVNEAVQESTESTEPQRDLMTFVEVETTTENVVEHTENVVEHTENVVEHTENVDVWLMMDVDPSVEREFVDAAVSRVEEQTDALHEEELPIDNATHETAMECALDDGEVLVESSIPSERSVDQVEENSVKLSTIIDEEPAEVEMHIEVPHEISAIDASPNLNAHAPLPPSSASLPNDHTIEQTPHLTMEVAASITHDVIVDEARLSFSGSTLASPSPPLRSTLPRPRERPLPRPASQPFLPKFLTAKLNAVIRPSTAESGLRPRLQPISMSPTPSSEIRLPRRHPPVVQDLSSASTSRLSTPVSSPSLRPIFGLRTSPRRKPRLSRQPRSGIRHVNHDTNFRSKILLARPKTAIPNHISAREYAAECIEAGGSSRLPAYALDPTEHDLLRNHINHVQVTTYLNIRNAILRLWLLNPSIAVCKEEALGVAKEERHLDIAAKCHEFLIRNGHINFGCIEPVKLIPRPGDTSHRPTARRQRVVVIGAGAAGLGCARQLDNLFHQFGDKFAQIPEIVVLEARERLGGRVFSKTIPQGGKVELGAQIVTGFENGNPLEPIINRQLGLKCHHVHDDTMALYDDVDGSRVDAVADHRGERLFNDILEQTSSVRGKIREQTLIEGDKELMDKGKEPMGDSGRIMAKVEENEAIIPPMPLSPGNDSQREEKRRNWRYALTEMGFTLKDANDSEPTEHVPENATLGQMMRTILSDVRNLVALSPMDFKLLNWHWANLEYGNATNLDNLSLKYWDQDDGNECPPGLCD
jgi:SWIRM domain/Flavin containing amine oxidoreductase